MTLTSSDVRIIVREETQDLKQLVLNLANQQSSFEAKQIDFDKKLDRFGEKQDRQEQEAHRQGIMLEDLQQNMRTIAEAVYPLLKKSAEMKDFDGTLRNHDAEIKITRTVLRDHIHDKSVHRKPKTGEI